jgi:surface carbohydrate biosynthesis protein
VSTRWLVVPSETRHREFDAKLWLACLAAERGLSTVVGSRVAIHLAAGGLPRAVWLAKDVFRSSLLMARLLRALGHRLTALDEEGLVWYSAESYRNARVHGGVLGLVEELFAWGEANAENWRAARGFRGQPIHVTGNPRFDLLRPELRGVFADEARAVEARFGRGFVLVSSNFGSVNHFVRGAGAHQHGAAGVARSDAHAAWTRFQIRLGAHRRALFRAFLDLLPALARAFPERGIVVRPHPSEDPGTWRAAAAGLPNVEVTGEGPVAPWLLAAGALVHNGCTTAIEAHLIGTPALAYRPVRAEGLDLELPNALSEQACDAAALVRGCERALARACAPALAARQAELRERHLAGAAGPFAAERIVERLAALAALPAPRVSTSRRLRARIAVAGRRRYKLACSEVDGHKGSAAYGAHRFPPLARETVEARVASLRGLTGRFAGVAVQTLAPDVFAIVPGRSDGGR